MSEYSLTLHFSENKDSLLLDMAALLYDLGLAYEFGALLTEPDYARYKFTRFFWYRNGRRVSGTHRARAVKIVKRSPLVLEIALSSLGGLWVLLQILERVSNWSLTREKLELEVEKLRRDSVDARERVKERYVDQLDELGRLLAERDAGAVFDNLARRLSGSSSQLMDIELKGDSPDRTNE